MNLGYIRAMRQQAQQGTATSPQAPNAPKVDHGEAQPPKTQQNANKDPFGRLPVDEALRADVQALCLSGALDTPSAEVAAVERWAKDRKLWLPKAWAMWITFAAQSAAHHTPFFAMTRAGGFMGV
jgi:hypothetical protein